MGGDRRPTPNRRRRGLALTILAAAALLNVATGCSSDPAEPAISTTEPRVDTSDMTAVELVGGPVSFGDLDVKLLDIFEGTISVGLDLPDDGLIFDGLGPGDTATLGGWTMTVGLVTETAIYVTVVDPEGRTVT